MPPCGDDKDLIYEGIATHDALDGFHSFRVDDKDLIYEGIATNPRRSIQSGLW